MGILFAFHGEQALQVYEYGVPALAILDLVMPRMGGASTALQLRSPFPNLPILFTSGYSESTGACASQLADSSYLQKPYSPTSLGHAIRNILDSLPALPTPV